MKIGQPIRLKDGSVVNVTDIDCSLIKYHDRLNKKSGEVSVDDIMPLPFTFHRLSTNVYIDGNYLTQYGRDNGDLFVDYVKVKQFFEFYGGGEGYTSMNCFTYANTCFSSERLTHFLTMNGYVAKSTFGKFTSYTNMIIKATQDSFLRHYDNVVLFTNDPPIRAFVDWLGDSANIFIVSDSPSDFHEKLLGRVTHIKLTDILPYFSCPRKPK